MTHAQPPTSIRAMDIDALNASRAPARIEDETHAITVRDLDLYYGPKQALKKISMNIAKKKATAFIGPSGCGKSTLLRCFNRMNDLVDGCRVEGKLNLEGKNIYDNDVDISALRRNVGMVFQSPTRSRSRSTKTSPMVCASRASARRAYWTKPWSGR
jgi:phosphate transport system ATP-binding protein